jgi:hypothetical protein
MLLTPTKYRISVNKSKSMIQVSTLKITESIERMQGKVNAMVDD